MTGVEWCALLTQHLCPQVNHPGNSGTHGQILSLRGYHKSLYRALNDLVKFLLPLIIITQTLTLQLLR